MTYEDRKLVGGYLDPVLASYSIDMEVLKDLIWSEMSGDLDSVRRTGILMGLDIAMKVMEHHEMTDRAAHVVDLIHEYISQEEYV